MREHFLTKCELEVMDVIWNLGQATVQGVVDQLTRELAYTTVMTTMKILETKGVLERNGKVGRAYLYRPLVLRDEVREAMTGELTETLYGGSVKALVLGLLGSAAIDRAEIDELKAAIRSLETE